MPHVRFALFPLLMAAASAADSTPGVGLPKQSPFQSAGGAVAAAAASETIEFAGVSLMGKKTDLIFYDKTSKKSHWISEGETKEGIAVVRYDARREQAVIKLNGVEKILTLRKGAKSVSTPAGVPALPVGFNMATPNTAAPMPTVAPAPRAAPTMASAPSPTPVVPDAAPKPAAPATPETQAKQETEARMLVSDLLEIGMAQRKAYEEAQRKAAEGTPPPNATPTQPPGEPPPGTQPLPQKPNGE